MKITRQKMLITSGLFVAMVAVGAYFIYFYSYKQTIPQINQNGQETTVADMDAQKLMETIKKIESEEPPRIGKSPTEAEIYNSPYIKHIRLALNGYLNGSNDGVEDAASFKTSEVNCGLDSFDKMYYKSKFIIYDASDNDYGGVQADIVFIDKPDALFWTWVYRLGGDGEYSLRGFCKNGPPEEKKAKFKDYIDGIIKEAKYSL